MHPPRHSSSRVPRHRSGRRFGRRSRGDVGYPPVDRALAAGEGKAVLLVAGGSRAGVHGGLDAADCGIGILRPDERPPWGADVLTDPGLQQAAFLVATVGAARQVSTRSAYYALAGSAVGGAPNRDRSLGPLGTHRARRAPHRARGAPRRRGAPSTGEVRP